MTNDKGLWCLPIPLNQLRPWWIALPSLWPNEFKWFELSSTINRCASCAHSQMCLPECMDIGYYINSTKPTFFYSLGLDFSPRPFGLKWTLISVPSKRYSCLSMLNCWIPDLQTLDEQYQMSYILQLVSLSAELQFSCIIFFAGINKIFISAGGLRTSVSFYEVYTLSWFFLIF